MSEPAPPTRRKSLPLSPVRAATSPTPRFSLDARRVNFKEHRSISNVTLGPIDSHGRRKSSQAPRDRPSEEVYHDSRAATRREFRRRATTLQDYYRENPTLLPQLPFTWRHGFKRWRVGLLIFLMILDACLVPLILYYTMTYAGNVAGWITFAIVATIWGGPTYLEFAIRSWRLILKERFYRPLGTNSRWCFDITHWISTTVIAVVTAFLVIGSAPHIVFIRVLSMPGPGILLSLGGWLLFITSLSLAGRKAPFRISSTGKGEAVRPGVYYLVEDIVAVNAGGGRPYREGWAARYDASPVFRKMILDQSLFWSIPAVVLGSALTIIICLHQVPHPVAYGLGKFPPFQRRRRLTNNERRMGHAIPLGWNLGSDRDSMGKKRDAQRDCFVGTNS